MISLKNLLKTSVLGNIKSVKKVPLGIFSGLYLEIDPRYESQLYFGLYEIETYQWLRKSIKKSKSAIDVGAGYGELTVWFLSKPEIVQIHSFEPDPVRWPKFRTNLRANPFPVKNRLYLHEQPFMGEKAEETLRQAQEPVLLKIDIDGGEYELLKAIKLEIKNKKMFILIEVHSRELNQQCKSLLESAGFAFAEIKQGWWKKILPDYRPSEFNQWLVASNT